MAVLTEAFPQTRISEGTAFIYAMGLSRIPEEILTKATESAILRAERFPSLALILREAAEIATNLPTAEEALEEVTRRLDAAWKHAPRPKLSRLAAKAYGLAAVYIQAEQGAAGTWRAQFRRCYEGLREAEIRRWILSGQTKPAPEEPQD